VGIGALRGLAALAAVPLAPALYEEHFVLLVLLRPTKEVFLAGGFLVERGDVALLPIVLAALPFLVGGVWLFHALGRGFRDEIEGADLPWIAGRLLPPERIKAVGDAVEDGGPRLVFLGRLAAFPSTLVAAAAGTGRMELRDFLVADGLGALTSMSVALTLGYLLGEAYDTAGPWLTGVGVVALAAMALLLGRRLRAQGAGKHQRRAKRR
jgi:membrane protein DedA with SNARE-associated domain